MKIENTKALEILKKYKSKVWPYVERQLKSPNFPEQFVIPQHYLKYSKMHWTMLNDYPSRKGKYTRPTVLLLIALALGDKINKIIPTAAAMQISEDWILIHDDYEDDSIERRGLPALHKIYGPELAVNAGDSLHVIMWNTLTNNFKLLGEKKAIKIINEFYVMLTRTTLGQSSEIKITKENILDFSDEDYIFIIDGKTSYYSVAGPMRLGAIIAGANEKQLDLITDFGLNLGRCYQLVDDLLDVTSDFAGLKKQKGNDIYESKRTLILGHLLRNAKPKDKEKLIKIISKKRSVKTQDEVDWVISKMHEYKSIEYSQNKAKFFKEKAEEILNNKLTFLNKEPYISELKTLMNFILERDH
jgi:geranylgeranyl diphosphate synthase type II